MFSITSFCLVLQTVALCTTRRAEGQDSKAELRSGFDKGVLSEHADEIRPTLTLTVDKKQRMVIDRKSWDANAMTKEERIEEIMKKYRGRGVDEEHVKRIAESQASMDGGPLMDTIEKFVNASHGDSGGHSRSGNNCTWRNGKCDISINSVGDTRLIRVDELDNKYCSLSVVDSGDGMLRIAYSSINTMWQVSQSKDGKLGATMIVDNEGISMTGENWDDLLKKHPTSGRLLTEMMVHVGFELPLSPNDPRVINEVALKLRSLYGGLQEDFDEIMKRINSDEFETRETAREELVVRFDELKSFVEQALKDKQGTLQQRTTLNQVKVEIDKKKKYIRFAEYVESTNLLSDPKYLASLLNNANESTKVMLVKRLKDLTKKDFGDNSKAWIEFVNQ